MQRQNITLSIPKDILQKAKIVAIQREISLSKLLSDALAEIVAKEDDYELAKQRQMQRLNHPYNFGIKGKITWSREELYER